MKYPIFNYALKSISRNRKKSAFSVFCVALFICCICSMVILTISYMHSNQEYLASLYGDQDIIIKNVEQDNMKIFESNEMVETFGVIKSFAFEKIPNLIYEDYIILGTLDSNSKQLSKLALNGNWPTQDNEIVLEKSLCSKLRISDELGANVNLEYTDFYSGKVQTKNFKIVGIINNYSSIQGGTNNTSNTELRLPNAIVSDDWSDSVTITHLSVKLKNASDFNLFFQNAIAPQSLSYFFNPLTSGSGVTSFSDNQYILTLLVIILISTAFVGVFSLYANTAVNQNRKKEQLFLLKLSGASNRNILGYFLFDSILLFLIAVPIGTLVGWLLTYILSESVIKQSVPFYAFHVSLVSFVLVLVMAFVLTVLFNLITYFKHKDLKPIEILQYKNSGQGLSKNIKIKIKNPVLSWGIKSALLNSSKFASIIISFALFMAIFLFGDMITKTAIMTAESTVLSDYSVTQFDGNSVTALQMPLHISSGIQQEDYQLLLDCTEIKNCFGIKQVPMKVVIENNAQNSVFIEKYPISEINAWGFSDDVAEDKKKYGYAAGDLLFPTYVYILDDASLNKLQDYVISGTKTFASDPFDSGVVIIEGESKSPYKIGDDVKFSQLVKSTDDLTDLEAKKVDLEANVAAIVKIPNDNSDLSKIVFNNQFTFVMKETAFSALNKKLNYTVIYVSLDDPEKYEKTETILANIRNIYPDSVIRSHADEANEQRLAILCIRIVFNILTIIIASFSFLIFGITFYNIIYERKRLWGTLRSMGLQLKEALIYQIAEISSIVIISWIIGNLLSFLCGGILISQIEFSVAAMFPYLFSIFALMFSVLFCILVCLIPFRSIFRTNINSLITNID